MISEAKFERANSLYSHIKSEGKKRVSMRVHFIHEREQEYFSSTGTRGRK
jgi:hypothetical protein